MSDTISFQLVLRINMLPFATSRWRRSGGMHSAAIACLHSNEHCAIYAYKLLREEDHESPLCVESLLARTYGEKIRQENTHKELTCQEPTRASSKTKRASHDRRLCSSNAEVDSPSSRLDPLVDQTQFAGN